MDIPNHQNFIDILKKNASNLHFCITFVLMLNVRSFIFLHKCRFYSYI